MLDNNFQVSKYHSIKNIDHYHPMYIFYIKKTILLFAKSLELQFDKGSHKQ